MTLNPSTPWHRESFERFMYERLPHLLAERLPLVRYGVEESGAYTCRVQLALRTPTGEVENTYEDLPRPDENGMFLIEGEERVVVPVAATVDLEEAEVRCVGERLYELIDSRLKSNPGDLPDDVEIARAWLPLDTWVREFMAQAADLLQTQNWLAWRTHLRRLWIEDSSALISPAYQGRICLQETPEGPNIGRMITIATGAEIRDGRVVITDESVPARLGLSASMIPFLENSEPCRPVMGANMMRQWIPPAPPEPALVQTGNEPDLPDFWCGRNLLTAYIAWGGDTIEDGIVISASCSQCFGFDQPLEPGDKLSNRHGTKGVVARILPDEEMPHLPDNTPVDLVYSFLGLPSRLNFGQVREALMGRMAAVSGAPRIVPPFQAPDEEALRQDLAALGLPEDGMEQLTANGRKLEQRSMVGRVYWGCTNHLARDKIHSSTDGTRCQLQGEWEYFVLRQAKAYETIRANYSTQATDQRDGATLAARVAQGPAEQAPPPAPNFATLQERLALAGIRAKLEGEELAFHLAPPSGDKLELACPLPHPWLSSHQVEEIGAFEEAPEYQDLVAANQRLQRILGSSAPARLQSRAQADLEAALSAFGDALLTSSHLRFEARINFSGRTVLAPGPELRLDQLGVPEEIAWTLYGPLAAREVGEKAVQARNPEALEALDQAMAREWIVLFRAPALMPTAFIAFHGVRLPERVLRINPLVCSLMNADFDGDQAAVLLPITREGQREAGELLSMAGHCATDPSLLEKMWWDRMDAMWGLACLGLTPAGREEINQLIGHEVSPTGPTIAPADLAAALAEIMAGQGVEPALRANESLLQRGSEVARQSGASLSPFPGAGLELPPVPAEENEEVWDIYAEEVAAQLAAYERFADSDIGPLCLGVHSGARATWQQLAMTVGVLRPPQGGGPGQHALRQGLTPDEMWALAGHVWRVWRKMHGQAAQTGREIRAHDLAPGLSVLARARRAAHPGLVFARAAAAGERDPLEDEFSRLFVGLPMK